MRPSLDRVMISHEIETNQHLVALFLQFDYQLLALPAGRPLTAQEYEYLGWNNGRHLNGQLTFAEYCELPHEQPLDERGAEWMAQMLARLDQISQRSVDLQSPDDWI
jgi:hypothetical protein